MVLTDNNERTPQDLTRIRLDQDSEVRYWCTRYGVTDAELRACVEEVGPLTADVARHLQGRGKQIFDNMGED